MKKCFISVYLENQGDPEIMVDFAKGQHPLLPRRLFLPKKRISPGDRSLGELRGLGFGSRGSPVGVAMILAAFDVHYLEMERSP